MYQQICHKVEKILKGSLDSGFDLITFKELCTFDFFFRQNIVWRCQQTFCPKSFVDSTQQCFAFTPQANFPAHKLDFHRR